MGLAYPTNGVVRSWSARRRMRSSGTVRPSAVVC